MYDNLSKYEFKASFRSLEDENWKCSILHNFQQRSGPIWADRVAFSNFLNFSKNKTRWIFCIFFSKIVHQKGLFEKIKKNSIFWCCLGILDIYGRAFLSPRSKFQPDLFWNYFAVYNSRKLQKKKWHILLTSRLEGKPCLSRTKKQETVLLSRYSVYICKYRGYYMGACGYEFYLRVLIIWGILSTRESNEKIKFVSTSGHVTFCLLIYTSRWNIQRIRNCQRQNSQFYFFQIISNIIERNW